MELNRCAYAILRILQTQNATDRYHGMTIEELREIESVSKHNTIHKNVKMLQAQEYVDEGIKSGKAKTYFLKGKKTEQIFKEDEPA
jgi:DNA-binding transcriptional regulator GbsR (MarR family)